MAKLLMLNADTDFPQNWTLPDGTDIEALRDKIEGSMVAGEVIQIDIWLGPDLSPVPTTLLVNASKLASAIVVEMPEPRPFANASLMIDFPLGREN